MQNSTHVHTHAYKHVHVHTHTHTHRHTHTHNVQEDELDEAELPGFDANVQTLWCSNVAHDQLVQVRGAFCTLMPYCDASMPTCRCCGAPMWHTTSSCR